MKTCLLIPLLAAAISVGVFAQPAIRSAAPVLNAASYAIPPLPNSSIAQGSIFAIFGSNLGPATGVQPSGFPLPTTLPASGGSSVAVTVNGTTVNAYLFYVSASQINALMPSKTPVGTGTIAVTYNGQTSATAPVTITANSVGIFTIASSGTGPGVFTDFQLSNKEVSYTNAANAGERVTAWATGLGAISGDDSQVPPSGNITASNAKVFVGGTPATVHYYGRSGCCSGLDQVSFDVPSGITGCNVPVSIETNNTISNFPTLAIAATGSRTCQDTYSGLAGSVYQSIFKNGTARVGSAILFRSTSTETLPPPLGTGSPQTTTTDEAIASFQKDTFSAPSAAGLSFAYANIGACSVYTFTGQSNSVTGSFTSVGLDAGTVSLSGPNGTQQLNALETGTYIAELGSNAPGSTSPLFLSPGTYTYSNGSGGADVKGFNFNLIMPSGLAWTNQSSINTITRSDGVTVTWTGATGQVVISGFSESGSDTSNLVGAGFVCLANASAGTFTVPAQVLEALPPSSTISTDGITIQTGELIVGDYSAPVSFSATGLDYGYALAEDTIDQPVTYQ